MKCCVRSHWPKTIATAEELSDIRTFSIVSYYRSLCNEMQRKSNTTDRLLSIGIYFSHANRQHVHTWYSNLTERFFSISEVGFKCLLSMQSSVLYARDRLVLAGPLCVSLQPTWLVGRWHVNRPSSMFRRHAPANQRQPTSIRTSHRPTDGTWPVQLNGWARVRLLYIVKCMRVYYLLIITMFIYLLLISLYFCLPANICNSAYCKSGVLCRHAGTATAPCLRNRKYPPINKNLFNSAILNRINCLLKLQTFLGGSHDIF